MRLWVDRELPSVTVIVQIVDEHSGLIVEHGCVDFEGGLVETSGGQSTVGHPTKYVSIVSYSGVK